MIQHLTPLLFQKYGAVLSERKDASKEFPYHTFRQVLSLSSIDSPVYLSTSDTILYNRSGNAILSVFGENAPPQNFYLDKPVRLLPGVRFSLTALQGHTMAEISAPSAPEEDGSYIPTESLYVNSSLQASRLCTFFYHEKEQGFFFPGESHSMLELTYIDKGSLHSVSDGQDILLQQGDIALYAPEQWHMQYADVGVAPRYVTISFDISGGDLSCLYNKKITVPPKALSLLQQIMLEQQSAGAYAADMTLALLTQLLIVLLRESTNSNPVWKPSLSVNNENDIVRRAQQYISKHVQQKLSVPLVAKSIDISASYLTGLFHKHLQISPGEYIRRIKLQESKQLIRESSLNFTEISTLLQYSSVHHFSRQFKEHFGITPSEYAKSVR